nr:hypothetical protein [uncultured Aminipila sp.]
MQNNQIRYFEYASVDFLIDKHGTPIFMEVNDNTLAPYYIEIKNKLAQLAISKNTDLQNLTEQHKNIFISCFKKYFNNSYSKIINEEIAILCKRRNHPEEIEKEIQFLIKIFKEAGFQADMYTPEECTIQDNILYTGNSLNKPAVIYRRNFQFPPATIKQPVVNDLRVREIAKDKYKTHECINSLIRKSNLKFRQPESYLVADEELLKEKIQGFFDRKLDCIAKPNSSYGGKGFFSFTNAKALENKYKIIEISQAMQKGEQYLVQERIEPSLFRSADQKEYCFDIRVMVYGGKVAGIEGRRSYIPYCTNNSNRLFEKSLVTNISSGGVDLVVLCSDNVISMHEARKCLNLDEISELGFKLDQNFLILSTHLVENLRTISEAIVKSIDERISTEVGLNE